MRWLFETSKFATEYLTGKFLDNLELWSFLIEYKIL